ncbi:MAG: DNA polymerase III subunit delta' [Burkholderiales bacterium]|nr:MAG: DNA polymerase III subunit delta' [Burkholderiales bacterium]
MSAGPERSRQAGPPAGSAAEGPSAGNGRPLPSWLARQLTQLLGQRGHALLLQGPSGLGQYELGLALARAWLCERPGEQGACGQCASCHAIDVRTHPDLAVLMPETTSQELGWPLDEKTQKELEDKKRKPSRLIRVEAARSAIAFAQLTRSRGSCKVVLVYPAERMNIESANTLLKTLEEPTGQVRFILASEAAHQLLPTVRSRCQAHTLWWPRPQEALEWLRAVALSEGLQPADEASLQTWLRAAGGRPQDALQWARAGLSAATWSRLPRAMAAGDWSLLSDWPLAVQLDVMQKLCHDLMAVAGGGSPRYFESAHLPPAPSWAGLARWCRDLMQAARTVDHPFQQALTQHAWSERTRERLGPAHSAAS